jgi:uncharacterized glyoxalase superfamily protein PhnB
MAAKKKKVKQQVRKKVSRGAPAKKIDAVPRLYGTATAHLIVSPAVDALRFYEAAFDARTLTLMPGPGGLLLHAEVKIGDSVVMLSDEQPAAPGRPLVRKSPKSLGGTTGGVMLYVPDVDATLARAAAAGAKVVMPATDMFWGDRYGQLEDPFGHVWAVATHVRDVTAEEQRAALASMQPQQQPPPPPPEAYLP